MKKRLLFLLPFILLSVGCNQKTISFSGESNNWRGEYSAHISDNGTREDGEYTDIFSLDFLVSKRLEEK